MAALLYAGLSHADDFYQVTNISLAGKNNSGYTLEHTYSLPFYVSSSSSSAFLSANCSSFNFKLNGTTMSFGGNWNGYCQPDNGNSVSSNPYVVVTITSTPVSCESGQEPNENGVCQATTNCDDGYIYSDEYSACVSVCEDGYTNDPVTYECVAVDGGGSGGSGGGSGGGIDTTDDFPEPTVCTSSESCKLVAESSCDSYDAEVIDYYYLGGNQYYYDCGTQTATCDVGKSWSVTEQMCLLDIDGDGIVDAEDIAPDDTDVTGDTDGDGVVDSNDPDPDDPLVWNPTQYQPVNISPTPVPAIGESSNFNDSSIVDAINETNALAAETNDKLDSLQETQSATNNLVNQSNDIAQEGNSLLSDIKQLLDTSGVSETDIPNPDDQDFDEQIQTSLDGLMDTFEQDESSFDGARVFTQADGEFISTLFGDLSLSECNNPTIWNDYTIDLCSRAPEINNILSYVLAIFTLVMLWHELHIAIRRQ